MARPEFVGAATGGRTGSSSTSLTVSLTALTGGIAASPADGDIVVVLAVTGTKANRTLSIKDPATVDYTLIGSELYSDDFVDTNLRLAYKFMGATPDASVVIGPSGSGQDALTVVVHVWRGVDATTPLDVAVTTATGINTGRPNPPAITPTTADAVVLAAGGAAAAIGAVFTASELANFRSVTQADSNDSMSGMGSFDWVSGAFDPAGWLGGTTAATDSWAAITMALRPAAAGTTFFQALNYAHTGAVALVKQTGKQLAPSHTSAMSLVKKTSKAVAYAHLGSVALIKKTSKSQNYGHTAGMTLGATTLFTQALNYAHAAAMSLTKITTFARTLSYGHTAAVSLVKATGKVLGYPHTAAITLTKQTGKRLSLAHVASMTLTSETLFLQALNYGHVAAMSLSKMTSKVVSFAHVISASLVKTTSKNLAYAHTAAISLGRAATFKKAISLAHVSTITLAAAATFTKAISYVSSSAVSLAKLFIAGMGGGGGEAAGSFYRRLRSYRRFFVRGGKI